MRVVLLANNRTGLELTRWLRGQPEDEIAGVIVHPAGRARLRDEIIEASGVALGRVIDGSTLCDSQVLSCVREFGGEIAVSILFDYILRGPFLDMFPKGVLNLHPSYLPFNRGQNPNVWSIVEGTPSGVTLHYLDEGIDTGDLVAQREVAVSPVDTGETLYRRLEGEMAALFRETWPFVRTGAHERRRQPSEGGTVHRRRDVERIDRIDLDRSYSARELLNVLRARTFPPHEGAYFIEGGRKILVRVSLSYAEDGHVQQ